MSMGPELTSVCLSVCPLELALGHPLSHEWRVGHLLLPAPPGGSVPPFTFRQACQENSSLVLAWMGSFSFLFPSDSFPSTPCTASLTQDWLQGDPT